MADFRGIPPMDMSGNLTENWKLWIQKFKNYLIASEANVKSEELQCAQLLQFIGDEGFRIFNTFKLEKEEKNKLKPLIREFEKYFQPKTNLVYERHKFLTRKQLEGESVQQFITDLKNKVKSCQFKELEDSLVCSVLIMGLIDDKLRGKLLESEELILIKAVHMCLAAEETKKQVQEMSGVKESGPSYHSRQPSTSFSSSILQNQQFRSSSANKGWSDCPTQDGIQIINCSRCGMTHQARKCPAFDTGAMTNVLSLKTFKNIGIEENLIRKTNIKLTSYSNEVIPVVGVRIVYKLDKQYKRNITIERVKHVITILKNKEKVLIKKKLSDKKWKSGTITSESPSRPRSYNVQIDNGNTIARNRQFIRSYPRSENHNSDDSDDESIPDSFTGENECSPSSSMSNDDVVFVPSVTRSVGQGIQPAAELFLTHLGLELGEQLFAQKVYQITSCSVSKD
ncbi:hypothetical protein NQ317_005541 [Molorchus minor]|uniref:Retrotransposon gag domain-containing protein n=1 Tax=Molorchus minor TaxID=1323400 RepID=A0ABQ9J8V1_9CUCU|nr:hypothetical protein NQ317_005541 [Molorchus minor]